MVVSIQIHYMKYLIGLLSTLLLLSCSSIDQNALNNVEQLEKRVDNLQKEFSNIDHAALKNAKKQYDESLYYIKKYYYKDTIDTQFMNSLDYYKNIKISTKVINKNKDLISENFEVVNSQLSILTEDLNNTAIQGEKLKEALANETNNVNQLDSLVTYYSQNAETVLFVHDSIAGFIKNKTLSF